MRKSALSTTKSAWPNEASSMMSKDHSRLTIDEAGDGLLRLVGEVDAATAPELARYLDNDPRVRVLDMAQVTFIDSSGLKVLVIANRSRDASERITLRPVSPAARRVLELAGMTEWLGVAAEPE
jgi:anti-anti-sigma factor